jgi:hypothetical protein
VCRGGRIVAEVDAQGRHRVPGAQPSLQLRQRCVICSKHAAITRPALTNRYERLNKVQGHSLELVQLRQRVQVLQCTRLPSHQASWHFEPRDLAAEVRVCRFCSGTDRRHHDWRPPTGT